MSSISAAGPSRATFTDGLVRELDFTSALPGVLTTIDNDEAFADAWVDPVAGTVAWPNGIDLDPDVLHGDQMSASAVKPHLLPRVPATTTLTLNLPRRHPHGSPEQRRPNRLSPNDPTTH